MTEPSSEAEKLVRDELESMIEVEIYRKKIEATRKYLKRLRQKHAAAGQVLGELRKTRQRFDRERRRSSGTQEAGE